MRREQVLSVALKDVADFRTSRYAFYSLVIPPLAFGLLLPVFYMVPFQAGIAPAPHALDIAGVTDYNANASSRVLDHVRIDGRPFDNAKVNGSVISNTTVTNSFVSHSLLTNVRLVNSTVVDSNLAGNTTQVGGNLVGAVYVDREDPTEAMLATVFFSLLLMMLMIIPSVVPTVLASYSLVGEKVSGSLEPLLATPSTDGEILAGKVTAILVPTLAVCWLGGALSLVVTSTMGGKLIERHPVPLDAFAAASLLFVPAFALLSILANVVISSRVSDVRAAQQLGGMVVLPVVLLFIGSMAGMRTMDTATIAASAAGVAAGDLALAGLCLRLFRREEILVRWK